MTDNLPLDPHAGPTAWVDIEQIDTVEEYHIRIKSGLDPEDPSTEILLNKREALKLANTIIEEVDD